MIIFNARHNPAIASTTRPIDTMLFNVNAGDGTVFNNLEIKNIAPAVKIAPIVAGIASKPAIVVDKNNAPIDNMQAFMPFMLFITLFLPPLPSALVIAANALKHSNTIVSPIIVATPPMAAGIAIMPASVTIENNFKILLNMLLMSLSFLLTDSKWFVFRSLLYFSLLNILNVLSIAPLKTHLTTKPITDAGMASRPAFIVVLNKPEMLSME